MVEFKVTHYHDRDDVIDLCRLEMLKNENVIMYAPNLDDEAMEKLLYALVEAYFTMGQKYDELEDTFKDEAKVRWLLIRLKKE